MCSIRDDDSFASIFSRLDDMIDGGRLEPHSHTCLSIPITTLPDGSYALSTLLLYVAFQILIEFMRSNGLDETDWAEMESVRDEIIRLYDWWMVVRPARKSPLEYDGAPDFSGNDAREYTMYLKALSEDAKLHMAWEQEDQDNLVRLINVRRYL